MRTKTLLTVFHLLFACFCSVAQTDLKTLVNPTPPNISSFEKYGNIPINYSTGQISQNIHLYTFDVDANIKIPIDLSYNNSGMKPDYIPSWVGHGWDVMPGGYLLQDIRGLDDLMPGGLRYDQTSGIALANYLGGATSDPTLRYHYIKSVLNGNSDTQPDIFSLNLFGKSTKFYFDGTVVKFIKQEPYKVDYIGGQQFIISDEKGYKYYFLNSAANSETSVTDPNGKAPMGGSRTWNLNKIVTPNNETVDFQYSGDAIYGVKNVNTSYTYGPSRIADSGIEYQIYSVFTGPSIGDSYTVVNQSILKSISFKGRKVNFETIPRNDLVTIYESSASALSRIQVLNENNQSVIVVDFSYNNNQRLRLDQISMLDNLTNAPIQRYSFEYYGDLTTIPLITSPNRVYGLDHWGYYNGASNSPFSVTDIDYSTFIAGLTDRFGHNNNSPSESLSRIGMLTKITYPTGGRTEIEYESNQVSYNSLVPQTYLSFVNSSIDTQVLLASTDCKEGSGGGTGGGGYEMGYFTVDHDIYAGITWYFTNANGSTATCQIFKVEGANITETITDKVGSNTSGTQMRSFSAGTYQYILNASCDEETTQNSVVLSIIGKELPPEGMIAHIGGNRVLRIKDFEKPGAIASVRKILYTNAELNQMPKYTDTYQVISEPFIESLWPHIITGPITRIGNINLTPQLGFPITYKQVTELMGENGENGKNVYYYGDQLIIGGDYFNPPYPSATPLSWRDNDLLKKEVYKNSGTSSFTKIQSTSYTFTPSPLPVSQSPDILKGIVFGVKAFVVLGNDIFSHYDEYFNSGGVYIPTDRYGLSAVVDTVFDENGSLLVDKTVNSYNNPDFLLSKTAKISSSGKLTETNTWYANDFSNIGNISTLKSKNMIGKPIKVTSTNSGNIVSGEAYTMDNMGNVVQVHKYENDSLVFATEHNANSYYPLGFLPRKTLTYDEYAQVNEFKETDGSTVAILWGYSGSYPIAEIRNASFQNLVDVLGQSTIDRLKGNNPGTDEQVRTLLNPLRTSAILKNSAVTTYTYKPLIGMTSMTDPKGMTIYYEYDSFQRLKNVKDHIGNIIKSGEYHYRP